ncbi:MAG TPA: dihydrolipoamide acetyltransferase family protein [Candidatus Thermoplasmatota archaeon]|nr:dihydrolipoamide acetyltransferase family protein [Candidatus Thermoplasmatota archaeon]
MAFEFKLPDIGEGVHEGEILKWLVKEGDVVKEDQPLVEIMTDKVNAAIPSPRAGRILKRFGKEGEVIKVGSVLLVIGEAGESAPVAPSAPAAHAAAPPQLERGVGMGAAPAAPAGKAQATPAVRKLARESGVNIEALPGTGPGGRVTEADVKAAKSGAAQVAPTRIAPPELPPGPRAAPAAVALTAIPPGEREERIPLRGLRKRIAEHMHEARSHAAHFTYVEEADMSEIVALRERAKTVAEARGVKLTFLPFILKAVTHAMKDHPLLNASLDEARQEIVVKRYYNLGIATNTDQGLIVPVIRDADRKSILELAREVEALAEKARTNKLTLADIQGSTFTITSVGKLGGVMSTPIVNYPEVAILGVNKIEKRAVVRDDKVVIRDMMNLSISLDHRVVDGYVGAVFLADVIKYLEDPNHFLL